MNFRVGARFRAHGDSDYIGELAGPINFTEWDVPWYIRGTYSHSNTWPTRDLERHYENGHFLEYSPSLKFIELFI